MCSDLLGKLLHKRGVAAANEAQEYEQWCMQIAKKFSGMYKAYRKFSVRYLGIDPSEKEGGGVIEETKEPGMNGSNSQSSKNIDGEEIKEEEVLVIKQPLKILAQGEQKWSSDVREHLLKQGHKELMVKFAHENQAMWKTD
jgi:hypothetical protein